LSVSKLSERGYTTISSPDGCNIYRNAKVKIEGQFFACAKEENGVYSLNCERDPKYANTAIAKRNDKLNLCHRRLGHLGITNMFLLKDMVMGLDFEKSAKLETCIACFKGKQTRLPFRSTGNSRRKELLQFIHSDVLVCGPMTESIGGAKYFVTFIDDRSRNCFVYMIKHKSEVIHIFKDFKTHAEKQTRKRIKAIRTDNGTEYVNNVYQTFLKENGIRHQLTVKSRNECSRGKGQQDHHREGKINAPGSFIRTEILGKGSQHSRVPEEPFPDQCPGRNST
jgi:hypothetical protein